MGQYLLPRQAWGYILDENQLLDQGRNGQKFFEPELF
jgi:hypothetical protein